jgi:3-oxoacyl-[acyl-carrier-protein] synthase III
MVENDLNNASSVSFFDRPHVELINLPIGPGIPVGIEQIYNPEVGLGGAYGAWGEAYDNKRLSQLIEQHLGKPLPADETMNLAELGFVSRHHIPQQLSTQEDIDLELQVGALFLRQAAAACGWDPSEVQGVLIGTSGPILPDYTEQIARAAGIPDNALKVSIHKACDGAVAGLNLALNPTLPANLTLQKNLANEFAGKKILVGGIEGLSRFLKTSHDKNALQLFGNGAGVIGLIPGQTMNLVTSKTHENYDEEGMLQVKMVYPYIGHQVEEHSLTQVSSVNENHYRVAGLMHVPVNDEPVVMAGLMGMVKLFVRTGVDVVKEVYLDYLKRVEEMGLSGKTFAAAVVHHANLKINKLKEKHLQRDGVSISMPWVLSDFGNVSAASAMIAFLRQLPGMKHGDHILIDGFGAGTYYDTLAVALRG